MNAVIACPCCNELHPFTRSNIDPHKNMMCQGCEYELPREAFDRIAALESDLRAALSELKTARAELEAAMNELTALRRQIDGAGVLTVKACITSMGEYLQTNLDDLVYGKGIEPSETRTFKLVESTPATAPEEVKS